MTHNTTNTDTTSLDTAIVNLYLDGYRDGQAGKYRSEPKQQAMQALLTWAASKETTARLEELNTIDKITDKIDADTGFGEFDALEEIEAHLLKRARELTNKEGKIGK